MKTRRTPMIDRNALRNDIPRDIARGAHRGTSHVPEQRGTQERDAYADGLLRDYERLAKLATTDEKREALAIEFNRYRSRMARETIAYLTAKGNCVSTMITGRSGFNVSRHRKSSNAADKALGRLQEHRIRALRAIRKALTPELQPIMSGDSDAVSRLREKIAKAESLHATIKAANRIVRGKPKNESTPEKLERLEALNGITADTAAKIFEPDYAGRIGFPSYQLTNNGANIRRMKERLAGLERTKAAPVNELKGSAATVEDDPPANRIRLYFPGKPGADVRNKLKRSGFRWAPSIGAWQAYRNPQSIITAERIAGVS